MYLNCGYMNNSAIDFKDKSNPLIVGSCGTYRLLTKPKLPTYRPRGRLDYQLIYISAGKAYFHFNNKDNETVITAGNMVLFRPNNNIEDAGEQRGILHSVHGESGDKTYDECKNQPERQTV